MSAASRALLSAALCLALATRALAGPPPPPPPGEPPPPPPEAPPGPYVPPLPCEPPCEPHAWYPEVHDPPPLPIAMRVIYAPFYVTGLVLRYGFYYLLVAPFEVFGRALAYGAEGGVDDDEHGK